MGNLCFKRKYNSLNTPINQDYNADIDFDTSMQLFDINNIQNAEELENFKNELIKTVSNLQNKINLLEDNLYRNNEQIDLIRKDLKSLLDNDRILNDKLSQLNHQECSRYGGQSASTPHPVV